MHFRTFLFPLYWLFWYWKQNPFIYEFSIIILPTFQFQASFIILIPHSDLPLSDKNRHFFFVHTCEFRIKIFIFLFNDFLSIHYGHHHIIFAFHHLYLLTSIRGLVLAYYFIWAIAPIYAQGLYKSHFLILFCQRWPLWLIWHDFTIPYVSFLSPNQTNCLFPLIGAFIALCPSGAFFLPYFHLSYLLACFSNWPAHPLTAFIGKLFTAQYARVLLPTSERFTPIFEHVFIFSFIGSYCQFLH